jgi:hypothetical protein
MTEFSPFSCPIFLGHPEARAAASKASGCIPGGTRNGSQGGTEKAEAAKLPDAGISPTQWPKKGAAEKGWLTGLDRSRYGTQTVVTASREKD